MRGVYNTLPFTKYPERLIIELCYASVFWLNCFHPCRNPINGMNPRTLVTGQEVDFHQHCAFKFGKYVHTHERTDNTMRPRTVGAFVLRPSGNSQGGHFFLSLLTGRRLHRHHVTRVPMLSEAIEWVHHMASRNPDGIHFCN